MLSVGIIVSHTEKRSFWVFWIVRSSVWLVATAIIPSLIWTLPIVASNYQMVLSWALGRFLILTYRSVSALLNTQGRPLANSHGSPFVQFSTLQYSVLYILAALVSLEMSSSTKEAHWTTPGFSFLVSWPVTWHPCRSIPGKSCGSPHSFPASQGSLSFAAWCLVSWKLSFYIFCLFCCCVFISGKRINQAPVIPSWPEADVRCKLNHFPRPHS